MWIPFLLLKNFKIAAFGHDFIAYRTVRPYALGNARHLSAASFNPSKEYAKTGLPAKSTQALADSGVKNVDVVGGAEVPVVGFSTVAASDVAVDDDGPVVRNDNGANASHEDVAAIVATRAKTAVDNLGMVVGIFLILCLVPRVYLSG